MSPSPRGPSPRDTAGRAFIRLLWQQPLWSLPFALFFGTIYGRGVFSSYVGAYILALIFAFSIGLALWVAQFVLQPRLLPAEWQPGTRNMVKHIALYVGASIVGSIVAAIIIHFTVFPGFLGSTQQVLALAMFTVLFAGLFTLGAYAISFYRSALDKARSDQELNLARRIQRSFLMSQFPTMPRLEVHATNVSSKQVSGDFYDVVPCGDRAFLLAIADVAGKGVPAALLSSMLQASLRTQAMGGAPVSEILKNINALVYRSTAVNQFATFFLARVEEDRMRLTFSNAGHNYPYVFRRDGTRLSLERGGTVVGILESASFEEDTVDLALGDVAVFYTDGISEASSPAGEFYGEDRLCELMRGLPLHLTASEVVERVLAAVREYTADAEPADDMTVMVLRVLEPAPLSPDGERPAAGPDGRAVATADARR